MNEVINEKNELMHEGLLKHKHVNQTAGNPRSDPYVNFEPLNYDASLHSQLRYNCF
jgi:hypothetical protein